MMRKLIWMQDNTLCHASHKTMEYLARKGFKDSHLIQWPSSSPDLNPYEDLQWWQEVQ